MEPQDRDPTFPEQDSGVPTTPAHSPDPPQPSASRPEPPDDPTRSTGGGERPSPAESARERSQGDTPGDAQADEGGPAVPDLSSGLSESNPAQGL